MAIVHEHVFNMPLQERMVQWSGAAYCCGTLGSGCSDWSCPSCQGDLDTTVRGRSAGVGLIAGLG